MKDSAMLQIKTHAMGTAIFLFLLAAFSAHSEDSTSNQVGRYSTVIAKPTNEQANILLTMATIDFPPEVKTVSQAIQYVLRPYGYRVSAAETADLRRKILLSLPLPKIHRSIGPMTIKATLETLAGPAWLLVEDPLRRLVSYEICTRGRK